MQSLQDNINNFIENKVVQSYPEQLHEQIIYFYSDGKRLRPCLLLCFNNYQNKDIAYHLAIIVETIHCLSLIIDDLPCMDNDQERRNKLTFHIKYGITDTYFFIYYMFNKLILTLNNLETELLPIDIIENDNKRSIISYILDLINKNLDGLIDGQFIDLKKNNLVDNRNDFPDIYNEERNLILQFFKNTNITDEQSNKLNSYIELNLKKTSTLFNLSCVLGLALQFIEYDIEFLNNDVIGHKLFPKIPIIINNRRGHKIIRENLNTMTGLELLDRISLWSNILGFLFQVTDDVLDQEIDIINNNANITNILNLQNSIEIILIGCKWLKEQLEKIEYHLHQLHLRLDIQFDNIIEIIEKIEKRIMN